MMIKIKIKQIKYKFKMTLMINKNNLKRLINKNTNLFKKVHLKDVHLNKLIQNQIFFKI